MIDRKEGLNTFSVYLLNSMVGPVWFSSVYMSSQSSGMGLLYYFIGLIFTLLVAGKTIKEHKNDLGVKLVLLLGVGVAVGLNFVLYGF